MPSACLSPTKFGPSASQPASHRQRSKIPAALCTVVASLFQMSGAGLKIPFDWSLAYIPLLSSTFCQIQILIEEARILKSHRDENAWHRCPGSRQRTLDPSTRTVNPTCIPALKCTDQVFDTLGLCLCQLLGARDFLSMHRLLSQPTKIYELAGFGQVFRKSPMPRPRQRGATCLYGTHISTHGADCPRELC